MNKQEMNNAIQAYLDGGGAVTRLREATEKDLRKVKTAHYHRDKAMAGNSRSKKIIENQNKKEDSFVFSKEERWSE